MMAKTDFLIVNLTVFTEKELESFVADVLDKLSMKECPHCYRGTDSAEYINTKDIKQFIKAWQKTNHQLLSKTTIS